MCFAVHCSKCGNTSWQGCGRHVESVYKGIPQGKHCLCKSWPGVQLPGASTATPVPAECAKTAK